MTQRIERREYDLMPSWRWQFHLVWGIVGATFIWGFFLYFGADKSGGDMSVARAWARWLHMHGWIWGVVLAPPVIEVYRAAREWIGSAHGSLVVDWWGLHVKNWRGEQSLIHWAEIVELRDVGRIEASVQRGSTDILTVRTDNRTIGIKPVTDDDGKEILARIVVGADLRQKRRGWRHTRYLRKW